MLVLSISALIVLGDQLTKQWVRDLFDYVPGRQKQVIDGFLNLTYVGNTGAAWGMLQNNNGRLAVLSVIVLVLLTLFHSKIMRDTLAHRIALGLMTGGIVGNLIDRLRVEHVIDLIDFYWGPHHFPSFNVADSAICVGVAIYIVSEALHARTHPGADAHASTSGDAGPSG